MTIVTHTLQVNTLTYALLPRSFKILIVTHTLQVNTFTYAYMLHSMCVSMSRYFVLLVTMLDKRHLYTQRVPGKDLHGFESRF